MKGKRIGILVLVFTVILTLPVLIASKGEESQMETKPETKTEAAAEEKVVEEEEWIYGISDLTFTHPFHRDWVDLQPEIDKDFGAKSIMKNAEWDTNQQIIDTEALIELGVDVLQVVPIDSVALAPTVEKAVARGIKVFAGASPVDVEGVVQAPLAGYDVFQDIAKVMAAEIDFKGKVFFITHSLTDTEGNARYEGFKKVMDSYPDIEFMEVQVTEGDVVKAANITEDWLNKYDDIAAIGYADSANALPASEVLRNHGKLNEIVINGYAGTEAAYDAVNDGALICDALISPTMWAWNTTQLAYRIYKGYPVNPVEPFNIPLILNKEKAMELSKKGLDLDELTWITVEEALDFGTKAPDIFGKTVTDAKYGN
jgi:ribose transport system substrate-binding protein